MIFGIGLVSATSPVVAEELGRRRHAVREVRRTVRQGLWSAVAIAVPIWLVAWWGEAILLATGQEPALAAAAGGYIRSLMWSLLPFLFYLVLRSFLAALERPGWALVVGLLAIPLNLAIAWVLMFGQFGFPRLGLAGAGIATTLTLAFEVTIFNAAALLMGRIGASELAAHAIALQIASFTFMVPMGVGQAVTVRVGLAYGAGDPDGVTRAGWTAFALGVGFMVFTALLMVLVPEALVGIFLDLADPKNAPVVAFAVSFLFLAAVFQLADGAQAVGAGMLRGLQDTRVPMMFALFGYWGIGLPAGVLLGFWTPLRGTGIWIGLALGLAVVAALMLWRWTRRERLGLVRAAP
jgi:MATE family multidrug resistance protein